MAPLPKMHCESSVYLSGPRGTRPEFHKPSWGFPNPACNSLRRRSYACPPWWLTCAVFFVTAQSISRYYGSIGTVHHRRRRAGNFFPSETPPETISEDGKPFHQVKGMYIMLCALLPTAIEAVIARLSTRRETGGDIMLHQKPPPSVWGRSCVRVISPHPTWIRSTDRILSKMALH